MRCWRNLLWITRGWHNESSYSRGCHFDPQPGSSPPPAGWTGLRDRAGLEAALAAPFQSFGGQELFQTDVEKIARLGYGLASNHAFLDGNKRIGAMMTQLLLRWNGYPLMLQPGELSDMFISLAAGTADEQALLGWIRAHLP